jgi:hypothetical protein
MSGCPTEDAPNSEADRMNDRYKTGMQVRREVLGDAHVDRAEAAKTEFDAPFQTLITEGAWGTSGPTTRSPGANARC